MDRLPLFLWDRLVGPASVFREGRDFCCADSENVETTGVEFLDDLLLATGPGTGTDEAAGSLARGYSVGLGFKVSSSMVVTGRETLASILATPISISRFRSLGASGVASLATASLDVTF